MRKPAIVLAFLALATPALPQGAASLDLDQHLLDGTSFIFQNQNADAADIAFSDGVVTYKWIAGRGADRPQVSVPYMSQKLDTDIYLVAWHEQESQTYVTMVYNFKSNTSSVSVIARYAGVTPFVGFQGGIIEHVVAD